MSRLGYTCSSADHFRRSANWLLWRVACVTDVKHERKSRVRPVHAHKPVDVLVAQVATDVGAFSNNCALVDEAAIDGDRSDIDVVDPHAHNIRCRAYSGELQHTHCSFQYQFEVARILARWCMASKQCYRRALVSCFWVQAGVKDNS